MWSSGLDRSFTNTGGAAEPVFQQGTWKSCITVGKVEMEQIGNTMKLLSVLLKEMAKIFENLKYEAWKMSFLLSKIGEIPIWWVADFTIQAPGGEWEAQSSDAFLLNRHGKGEWIHCAAFIFGTNGSSPSRILTMK